MAAGGQRGGACSGPEGSGRVRLGPIQDVQVVNRVWDWGGGWGLGVSSRQKVFSREAGPSPSVCSQEGHVSGSVASEQQSRRQGQSIQVAAGGRPQMAQYSACSHVFLAPTRYFIYF